MSDLHRLEGASTMMRVWLRGAAELLLECSSDEVGEPLLDRLLTALEAGAQRLTALRAGKMRDKLRVRAAGCLCATVHSFGMAIVSRMPRILQLGASLQDPLVLVALGAALSSQPSVLAAALPQLVQPLQFHLTGKQPPQVRREVHCALMFDLFLCNLSWYTQVVSALGSIASYSHEAFFPHAIHVLPPLISLLEGEMLYVGAEGTATIATIFEAIGTKVLHSLLWHIH